MKRFFCIAAIFFCLLHVSHAEERTKIISAEFGLFNTAENERSLFEKNNVIPKKAGQHYGWVIILETNKRSLSVREEYLLPNKNSASVQEASPDQIIEILPDRRVQISQRQLVPVNGRIVGEWEISPQEPEGRRVLQVIIEDVIAATFEFDVR